MVRQSTVIAQRRDQSDLPESVGHGQGMLYRRGNMVNFSFFFFWLHHVALGILIPLPRIERVSPAVKVWSLNHWTTKEVFF